MRVGPVLESDRLVLSPMTAQDIPAFHQLTLPQDMRLFLGSDEPSLGDSWDRAYRNAGSWALHGYGTFLVRQKGRRRVIGNCGVFHSYRGFGQGLDNVPEAGWVIAQSHWGMGLAGEAMRAALDWFDTTHGVQRIACMIEDGHAVSLALAGKLGFVRYGMHQPDDGERPLVLLERGADGAD